MASRLRYRETWVTDYLRRNDDRLGVGPSDRPDVGQGHGAAGQISFAELASKPEIVEPKNEEVVIILSVTSVASIIRQVTDQASK